jgi:hypothetical protein
MVSNVCNGISKNKTPQNYELTVNMPQAIYHHRHMFSLAVNMACYSVQSGSYHSMLQHSVQQLPWHITVFSLAVKKIFVYSEYENLWLLYIIKYSTIWISSFIFKFPILNWEEP